METGIYILNTSDGFRVAYSNVFKLVNNVKVKYMSHYTFLEPILPKFLEDCGINPEFAGGLLASHGDKAYSYKYIWEEAGIHFYHGVAIFLLSYFNPYSQEVRQTKNGWVPTEKWVINNYSRFKDFLPPVTN